jgi:hypothetical protein
MLFAAGSRALIEHTPDCVPTAGAPGEGTLDVGRHVGVWLENACAALC